MDRTWPRLDHGLGCLGTDRLWAHPFPSLTLRAPRAVVEPVDGPTFELLGLGGP